MSKKKKEPFMDRMRQRHQEREQQNAVVSTQTQQQEPTIRQQLKELDRACLDLLQHPAQLSSYLMDQELIAYGNYQQIEQQAKVMANDLAEFKDQLDGIRACVPSDLDIEDPEDIRKGLEISEWYQDWQDRYQRTVLPIVYDLIQLLQTAGENRDRAKTDTSSETEQNDE